MRSPRWAKAGSVALPMIAAVLVVSACGGSNAAGGAYGSGGSPTSSASGGYGSGGGNGYGSGGSGNTGSGAGTTAQGGALKTETTSTGTVLASSQGMTLYYYSVDKPHSGMSACSGSCASTWPPLTGTVQAPGGVTLPGAIGSITRQGGVHQVTINGYPVYTYVGDKSPGQVTGNGMAGEWHVIKLAAGAARGGMMKTETTTAGKVLANPHGMTVYYYAVDKPNSGASACTGGCAMDWPPVVAPVRIPAGIMLPGAGSVGTIIRPDGTRQVTINGYPIYRYSDDKAPGQAKGNGEGGVWHVIKL
jgi:predicted lipoprotein with Yx(FWY)xxD motif